MAHSGPVPEVRGAGADRLLRVKGFLLVLAAAVLWGLSGTAAQVLFQRYGFRPDWLVAVRMGVSGILLVTGTAIVSGPPAAWAVWRRPGDALRLAVFGLLGLFGVQYSYFASVAAGNAATATLLQYLAPTLIVVYEAWRGRQIPRVREGAAIVLAMAGTFLLATGGQFRALSISAACVIWGLVSAVTLAFYTLYPVGLVERFGAPAVVGWAMIIGAVPPALGGAARHLPELPSGEWVAAWGLTAFVVLFGTLVAFSFYLASLRYLSPAETSLLACAEPLSAVAATAMLGVHLGLAGAAGAACILAAVVLIATKGGSPAGERDA